MGQTICSYSSFTGNNGGGSSGGGGRTTTISYQNSCEFQEWPVLYDMFERNPMGLYIIHGIAIVLLAFIWLLSCLIRYKDYTRSFIMANLIPLTVYTVASLVTVLTGHYRGEAMYYYRPLTAPDYLVRLIAGATFDMTLAITLIGFQILNLQTARKRKETSCCWFFLVVPVVIAIIYAVLFLVPSLQYSSVDVYVFRGVVFVLGIVNFITLCSLCCCSSGRPGQASTPSVANARSRLGWSILFAIFAMLPVNLNFSIGQTFFMFYGYNMITLMTHIYQLIELLNPIVFCLSVLLFLPAYRSVFCCSQGYENNKVGEMQVVIQMKAEDLAANFQQMQKLPVPTASQDSSPYLKQAQTAPDFGAILTNPPNVTTYAVPPPPASVPHPTQAPVQVPPPCTCNQGAIQSQPPAVVPLDQYHQFVHQNPVMVQQPMMTQQLMSSPIVSSPMQGNLVRFASQPNLATMAAIQPAMSVPQLNMVSQSPFYIHN